MNKDLRVDRFVHLHPDGWFWHTTRWQQYIRLFHAGVEDHSMGFSDGLSSALRAWVPFVYEPSVRAFSMSGGDPLPVPVAEPDWAWTAWRYVLLCVQARKVSAWFRSPLPVVIPGEAFYGLGPFTVRACGWSTRVLDLTQPEQALWHDVRKSYRPLISRANRVFQIGLGEFSEYKSLHLETVAQVIPRLPQTYDCQEEWLRAGYGYQVVVHDGVEPLAAVYVIWYKGRAYYASGPSKAPDLICAAIWHAVMVAKGAGCHTFELGWQGHATDAKGQAIEFFKRGFGGYDEPVYCVEVQFG